MDYSASFSWEIFRYQLIICPQPQMVRNFRLLEVIAQPYMSYLDLPSCNQDKAYSVQKSKSIIPMLYLKKVCKFSCG